MTSITRTKLSGCLSQKSAGVEMPMTQEALFCLAADAMPIGLVMFNPNKKLVLANARFRALYALPADLWNLGADLETLLHLRFARDGVTLGDARQKVENIVAMVDKGEPHQRVDALHDGRWIRVTHQPLSCGGWVGTHEDVTEWMELQEKLQALAERDTLTGLYNRRVFQERIDALQGRDAISRARRHAVFMIDLDGFKPVNDSYGHDAGDHVLARFAERLDRLASRGDMVARLGGDEFALLKQDATVDSTRAVAAKIVEQAAAPVKFKNTRIFFGACVGASLWDVDTVSRRDVMKRADVALYAAKVEGRNLYRVYDELSAEATVV